MNCSLFDLITRKNYLFWLQKSVKNLGQKLNGIWKLELLRIIRLQIVCKLQACLNKRFSEWFEKKSSKYEGLLKKSLACREY